MSIPANWRELPALSIRQPWAWLILNAGKDVENRAWATRFRGRFLIHAAKGCTRAEFEAACEFSRLAGFRGEIPDLGDLPRGGIVGSVSLTGCANHSGSPWFVGPLGFALEDPEALPFQPCRGMLGFFKLSIPEETLDQVLGKLPETHLARRQLAGIRSNLTKLRGELTAARHP